MADIPAGAQRSPDGHYWWDEPNQTWQLVAGNDAGSSSGPSDASSSAAAPAAASTEPPARTGSISIELGVVAEDDHSHDEVVAMVERGGAQLPQGEAYA